MVIVHPAEKGLYLKLQNLTNEELKKIITPIYKYIEFFQESRYFL